MKQVFLFTVLLLFVSKIQSQNQTLLLNELGIPKSEKDIVQKEIELFETVKRKALSSTTSTINDLKTLETIKNKYRNLMKVRTKKLEEFDSKYPYEKNDYPDKIRNAKTSRARKAYRRIMKHKFENNKNYGKVSYKLYLKKGEFETEELFKERVEKHIALRRAYIKNITDSMKTLVKPYGNFSNLRKTYNAKKSKTVSNENESVYFDTYSPRLKNYLSSTIKEFRYNAELEYFTLKVYFNSSSKRKAGEKRYKIYVPLKDAEKFKKEREKHQYLFFLQDLRAVITGNKVYQIAPIYTWYIELACDKGVEESVLLINGKQSKKDIAEYIKSEVTNHPDFIKRAKDLLKLYKDRLNMTSSTSTFEVYFDEKGRYSNLDINHSTRVYLKSYEEYHRQEFNLEVEMKEILKAKDIRIKPRKNKCKAIRDSFRFEYTIRN